MKYFYDKNLNDKNQVKCKEELLFCKSDLKSDFNYMSSWQ